MQLLSVCCWTFNDLKTVKVGCSNSGLILVAFSDFFKKCLAIEKEVRRVGFAVGSWVAL